MLANFSKQLQTLVLTRLQMAIVLPVWMLVGFFGAQQLIVAAILLLYSLGLWTINTEGPLFNAVIAAVVYGLTLVLIIGIPWLVIKNRTTLRELGLTRLPSWTDILFAPLAVVVYFLLSGLLVSAATKLLPGFDQAEAQAIAFTNLTQNYEYLLAFLTLVVAAPIAEEVLFRGYLYGKLRQFTPIWIAAIVTSVLFGVVHGQLNVAIDVFALSIIACSLREMTGSIWAGVLLHMAKNGIAFYFLFINPSLLHTMGG